MKKQLSLIVVFFLMISPAIFAESGSEPHAPAAASLSGLVIDLQTGEALAGASVVVEGTNLKAFTDFEGKFVISDLKVGTYDLKVNYISYQEQKITQVNLYQGNDQLEVKLKSNGNE